MCRKNWEEKKTIKTQTKGEQNTSHILSSLFPNVSMKITKALHG